MSSFYKDPHRKVSMPTEADFLRGAAYNAAKPPTGANIALAIAAGLLMRKALRRKK